GLHLVTVHPDGEGRGCAPQGVAETQGPPFAVGAGVTEEVVAGHHGGPSCVVEAHIVPRPRSSRKEKYHTGGGREGWRVEKRRSPGGARRGLAPPGRGWQLFAPAGGAEARRRPAPA